MKVLSIEASLNNLEPEDNFVYTLFKHLDEAENKLNTEVLTSSIDYSPQKPVQKEK